jgi:hypothetical protein
MEQSFRAHLCRRKLTRSLSEHMDLTSQLGHCRAAIFHELLLIRQLMPKPLDLCPHLFHLASARFIGMKQRGFFAQSFLSQMV